MLKNRMLFVGSIALLLNAPVAVAKLCSASHYNEQVKAFNKAHKRAGQAYDEALPACNYRYYADPADERTLIDAKRTLDDIQVKHETVKSSLKSLQRQYERMDRSLDRIGKIYGHCGGKLERAASRMIDHGESVSDNTAEMVAQIRGCSKSQKAHIHNYDTYLKEARELGGRLMDLMKNVGERNYQ